MKEDIMKEYIRTLVLSKWTKEGLANRWCETHIKYIELRERIDKAIKYIENHREAVDERNEKILYWLTDDFDEEDILNILEGNEE